MATEKVFLGEYITRLVSDYFEAFPKEKEISEEDVSNTVETPKDEPAGIASELEKKFDEMMSVGSTEAPLQKEKQKRKLSNKNSFSLPKI